MNFSEFLEKDITVHTDTFHYRGILVDVLIGVLHFKKGVDEFYIDATKITAVTVHGREFGKESLDTNVKGKIEGNEETVE